MLLVDTSVWIEFFRRGSEFRFDGPYDLDEVVTCLPVIQEVLQGIHDQRAFRRVREAMLSLPIVESPLTTEVFLEAVELYRAARRAGLTVRSATDCLIAACAVRHSLPVLHLDRDFESLARVAPLEELTP